MQKANIEDMTTLNHEISEHEKNRLNHVAEVFVLNEYLKKNKEVGN